MDERDRADIQRLAESLTAAWNAADGTAFGAAFAEDADFVTIHAMHFDGRETIAKNHQMIFDTIYRGSRVTFAVSKVRELADGLAVVHFACHMHAPVGPSAGENNAVMTAVTRRDPAGWRIVAFHNTLKVPFPGGPPHPN